MEQLVNVEQAQRDLQMAVARSLEAEGEFTQAAENYRRVVQLDPKFVPAWHRLAVLEDRQGRCQEAVAYYQKALSLSPEDSSLLADFGYNCYLRRQWSDSETYLRRAIAKNQGMRRAHNNLGLLLAHTDRYDEAAAAFRRAGLTETEVHSNLAFATALKGDLDEARRQSQLAATQPAVGPSPGSGRQLAEAIDRAAAKQASLVSVSYSVEQPPTAHLLRSADHTQAN